MSGAATATPGPWVIMDGILRDDHILIVGDTDYAVAKVYDKEEGMEAVNAANARLIAAAPELLDELIALRKRFHAACRMTVTDEEFVVGSTPGADAAIAKATGAA